MVGVIVTDDDCGGERRYCAHTGRPRSLARLLSDFEPFDSSLECALEYTEGGLGGGRLVDLFSLVGSHEDFLEVGWYTGTGHGFGTAEVTNTGIVTKGCCALGFIRS